MSNQQQTKSLLDPYRTIGCFISGKLSLSQSSPSSLTAPTGCSFKVYSQNLTIKVASPCFPHPITAALSYNEYTYIRTLNAVIKMKYHHIVDQWQVKGGSEPCSLLKFQNIVILNYRNRLILIDESLNEVTEQQYDLEIKGIIHPITYVNKLIIYGQKSIVLVNAISNKVLYSFPNTTNHCAGNAIQLVEPSPIVDILAIALDNGLISFVNLRKDQVVFSIKQKLAATSLAFSQEQSWMASGDSTGNVILWDLSNKRILYKFDECLKGCIDSLAFLPGLPVLTCGSSFANSLRQLKVNLDDNKILSLYRQRQGSKESLEKVIIANNNELVLSTQNESMFVSFHSQCNSYILPRTLDSKLPYHLIARNFNVELYKNNSFQKNYQIHEYATTAKISLSNKYYIVATKRKMIKLGLSSPIEWNIPNIHRIILFNEHSIFAITPNQIIVCDFNTDTVLFRISVCAQAAATNPSNSLLSFFNKQTKCIQIWDMFKITQGRVFSTANFEDVLCLSFTSDNRFLISSHRNGKLNIWSIVDNELYKSYTLQNQNDMIWHSFTPDNQFMVSIFQGSKQANIWNNYIGRLTSVRMDEPLAFTPIIRRVNKDYRLELSNTSPSFSNQPLHEEDDVIDSIANADDGLPAYSFNDITKWMALVYYDQIRQRNAPNKSGETPSMPFFLDFKNLTEEKKKIEEELQKEMKQKRKEYRESKDKHLKNANNELTVNEQSSVEEQLDAFQQLASLSVAEVDYQLRSFLLTPSNKVHLVNMMRTALQDTSREINQELKNIILSRVLNLLGADLLSQQLIQPCNKLLLAIEPALNDLKERVDRCISISNKQTQ